MGNTSCSSSKIKCRMDKIRQAFQFMDNCKPFSRCMLWVLFTASMMQTNHTTTNGADLGKPSGVTKSQKKKSDSTRCGDTFSILGLACCQRCVHNGLTIVHSNTFLPCCGVNMGTQHVDSAYYSTPACLVIFTFPLVWAILPRTGGGHIMVTQTVLHIDG